MTPWAFWLLKRLEKIKHVKIDTPVSSDQESISHSKVVLRNL